MIENFAKKLNLKIHQKKDKIWRIQDVYSAKTFGKKGSRNSTFSQNFASFSHFSFMNRKAH